MRRFATWPALVGAGAAGVLLLLGAGSASAGFTGIAFTKGCASPVQAGQPYECAYSVLNVVNTDPDTVMVTGISDEVHAFAGDVSSGNILSALELVFSDPTVTCFGGSGAGTTADPYVGATMCALPIRASITSNTHSSYVVQAADFNLPSHLLTDTATLSWNNLCDGTPPGDSCSTGDQTATAGSAATVTAPQPSQTVTQVVDGADVPLIQAVAPATVHDVATVSGSPGGPAPTGQLVFEFFTNPGCTGTGSSEPPISGPPYSSMPRTLGAGLYSYVAHYMGDATFLPSDGSCEPFRVLDANIQISPVAATNAVRTNHKLTAHVNADDGTGPVPAAGTTVTFSLTGRGSFVPAGANTCTTDASGNCTVSISSAATGKTTIHAAAEVQVGGVFGGLVVHRETGDSNAGDGPDAVKQWVIPVAVVAQADATCDDVVNGAAATLGEIDYSVDRGKIDQGVDPGFFFYYAQITTTVPNQVVTVRQTNSSTNGAAPIVLSGAALLWTDDCVSKLTGNKTDGNSGASFTVPLPGSYVIALRYQTKPLARTVAPVPANITYSFTTSLGGNTGASVPLKRQ